MDKTDKLERMLLISIAVLLAVGVLVLVFMNLSLLGVIAQDCVNPVASNE